MNDDSPTNLSARAPDGLLIVGHGTRDEQGCAEFAELVRHVERLSPKTIVEGCFLELVQPDVLAGIARAKDRGARRLSIVPLLLVAAGHAKRDIPQLVAKAAEQFPSITLEQKAHLGSHPAIERLAQRRYDELAARLTPLPAEQTLLLLVGRGTKDEAANNGLCEYSRRRRDTIKAGWQETCFLAMAQPSFERALELVPRLGFPRIVVEPHLLFRGELLDRIAARLAQPAAECPGVEFVMTERLGPDVTLAQAVLELAGIASPAMVCRD